MKKLQAFFERAWRPGLVVLLLASITYLVFFHQINNLLPGYANSEIDTYHSSQHFKDIVAHPLYAPYKLLVYGIIRVAPHHLLATRIVSAASGVLACLLFFIVVRSWFNFRMAFLGTIMFATSGGLLHIARLGSPIVSQLAILLLLVGAIWLQRTARRAAALYLAAAVMLCALYIPGFVWFELVGVVLWRKQLLDEIRKISWQHLTVAGVFAAALLAPLIRACILFPSTIRAFFGLPDTFHLHDIITNFTHTLSAIGFHNYGTPDLWLGNSPLLNIIEIALLLLGAATFIRHWRLTRSVFVLASFILAFVLVGLGGPVVFAIVLPLLYLLIAGGVYELLRHWLEVFPRNPIARSAGILLVCALIFISALYQWRTYFIAWPHNPSTRATFSHHEI